MIQDQEDLPRQRTPSLGLGAAAYMSQPPVVDHTRVRPPGANTPLSAPPNISLLPPTPNKEMSQELVSLIHQKPPPPTPMTAPPSTTTAPSIPYQSHQHRPTPQQRQQKSSQTSHDSTLQQLQQQVPTGFRTGIVGIVPPVPDNIMSQADAAADAEQPPPLVPLQAPKDPHYIPEPRILKPSVQPPIPAPKPPVPAFAPRQGSAPPRFGGSYAANGAGERERVRSTSASSGPPLQPIRKVSSTTDPGTISSRGRPGADESPLDSTQFRPISSEASIPTTTFRQQQIKALADAYNVDGTSAETDSPSSADKSSGKGKFSLFGKSDTDKSDHVTKVLRRSNAYAAEKPTSPPKQSDAKPHRPEIGLVPQPFGTPRSPPVSSNTLEEAQVVDKT